MRILVTGFEPFGGDTENAAAAAVEVLAASWSGPQYLHTAVLPVSFREAPTALAALVDRHGPDVVLAVGEAGGRVAITPEVRARNIAHARIPDNAGDRPHSRRIDNGPEWVALPYRPAAAVAAIRAIGLPAELSGDAGTFVCNRVARQVAALGIPGGFVHVPAVRRRGRASVGPETDPMGGRASAALSIEQVALALARCLSTLIGDAGAIAVAGGPEGDKDQQP